MVFSSVQYVQVSNNFIKIQLLNFSKQFIVIEIMTILQEKESQTNFWKLIPNMGLGYNPASK